MSERPSKILTLDYDSEVLTRLQRVLEDAGLDTTITWDDVEARKLAQTTAFEVILAGNRPPELSAKTFLQSIKFPKQACLLLGARGSKARALRRLGISGVAQASPLQSSANSAGRIAVEKLRS